MRTAATPRRYRGKTLEERRAERRERLLAAGLELFGNRGYAQTTIEALCAHTHLNPRYFYEEFATREALLGAVYARHAEVVLQRVTAAIAAAPLDPLARLQIGLHAFLDGIRADPLGARINYFEMVGVSATLEAQRRDVLRTYADMISAQITEISRATPIPVRDHRLAAVAMVGATDGLIIDWLSSHPRPPFDRVATSLLELVESVLRGPQPA